MAVTGLRRAELDETNQAKTVLDEARRHCKGSGLRHFARRAGVDPANLNRVLKGRTEPNQLMLAKLQAPLAEEP
jgi:lambda repressor-like predicted transcriptional regulator